jgi:hypothetical protein
VADQVDLHKPRDGVVPLGPGPDRDLGFQQRAGLGVGSPARDQLRPFTGEFAVDGRRAYPHQQSSLLVGDRKLLIAAQQRHQGRQHRGQQPAGRCTQHRPAPNQ